MAENTKTVVTGLSFTQLLTITFIVLKLCNIITWSWWWVLSPLWLPFAAGLGIGIIAFIVFVLVKIFVDNEV